MPRSTDPLVIGGVIGDVLEPFTSSVSMGIVYNNCPQVINCCELKPSKILNRPRIEIGGDDLRTFYTLVLCNYVLIAFNLYYIFILIDLLYIELSTYVRFCHSLGSLIIMVDFIACMALT